MDCFEVVAAPQRRRILGELARAASSVNQLADTLGFNQPTVSKHLKVLREAGFVSVRGDAQQRIYQLQPQPFHELDAWLEPYRRLWSTHLDALERHLDARASKEKSHEQRQVRTKPARGRQHPRRR